MGVQHMIQKVRDALKAGEAKKKAETSRINLDAELDAVRAKIDAKLEEDRKADHAAGRK